MEQPALFSLPSSSAAGHWPAALPSPNVEAAQPGAVAAPASRLEVSFTVYGQPVAQGRPIAGRWKSNDGRSGTTLRDPEKSRSWKGKAAAILMAAIESRGLSAPVFGDSSPVALTITAIFPCPKSDHRKTSLVPRRWHVTARSNDFDNIAKAVADACSGLLFADDGQVVQAVVYKVRGAQGEAPRVEVHATEAGEVASSGTHT